MNDEAVRCAMRTLSEAAPRTLPDAKKIWWLAEIRRRQEKRHRVTRIMTWTRVSTSVAAVLGAGGIALWQEINLPSLGFLAAAAVVCAAATGARAMLARE